MQKKLFVAKVADSVTTEMLEELFGQAGEVASAAIITDRMTGASRGFAFVEMVTEEGAKAAIEKFNGYQLEGKSLVVNEAKPQEDRSHSNNGGRDRSFRKSW